MHLVQLIGLNLALETAIYRSKHDTDRLALRCALALFLAGFQKLLIQLFAHEADAGAIQAAHKCCT
jgi:hypothetical protein